MSINTRLRCFVFMSLLLFGGSVYAQSHSSRDALVRLTEEGKLYVGENQTELVKLAAQLKKSRIKKQTQITIEIPQNTSPNTLSAIGRELASNGFRRFVFSKPRKTVVEKGADPLLKNRH